MTPLLWVKLPSSLAFLVVLVAPASPSLRQPPPETGHGTGSIVSLVPGKGGGLALTFPLSPAPMKVWRCTPLATCGPTYPSQTPSPLEPSLCYGQCQNLPTSHHSSSPPSHPAARCDWSSVWEHPHPPNSHHSYTTHLDQHLSLVSHHSLLHLPLGT